MTDRKPNTQRMHTRNTVLLGIVVLLGFLGWLQWRSLASQRNTYDAAQTQLHQMLADSARIVALREAPRAANERVRPNDELLAQIQHALSAASIGRDNWLDSIPQPPVRVPKSDYKRMTTRIYLENVSLKEIAEFSHALSAADPTLTTSAINLSKRTVDASSFNADLGVSYQVYVPRGPG